MASMPRGQPQSVPDPEGDLYDQEMAKLRAARIAEEQDVRPPPGPEASGGQGGGFHISHPNTLESFIPVVGPAWEAAADLQDGNYLGAGLNTALAVADFFPAADLIKGVRAASKGIGLLKSGSVTADAARKVIRRVGLAGPGEEIHHSVPLNGLSRNAQSWKNHYPFLKTLDQEVHRRLTGSWMGKPRYDPLRRFWYGTPDWMKAPVGVAGHVGQVVQHEEPPSPDSE